MNIKESPLGGWKGSAVYSIFCLIMVVLGFISDEPSSAYGWFIAMCGWLGWSAQEYQHLRGDVIIKRK